jgi:serine/threonine-protein kinase
MRACTAGVDALSSARQHWAVTEARSDADFLSLQAALAGRYSLERELGRGGMGIVFLAREVRLDRPVAIKLLPPALATSAALRERFLREARLAARLSHPYIVPIHAVDEASGHVFYVMAYVDGDTLSQRVARRGPMNPADATRMLREVAWALAYAHGHGIVHRDVKPANILIENGSGRAMVTDFGIAQAASHPGDTATGTVIGTPEYMSPEQARGEPVDGRSDLYALGAVGYFALTGAAPFTAPTAQAVLMMQAGSEAPSLAAGERRVPRTLALAIDRCLEKDPADRFDRGETLADALGEAASRTAEVPAPVRIFLDRNRTVTLFFAAYASFALGVTVVEAVSALHGALGFLSATVIALAPPIALLASRMRSLLRIGYGPEDVVAGLRYEQQQRREEFLFEYGPRISKRERLARIATIAAGASAVGLTLLGIAFRKGPASEAAFALAWLSFMGALLTGITTLRWHRLRSERTVPLRVRFWRGWPGSFITRLASFRLTRTTVAADRPTELMIAASAEALYASLDKPARKALAGVPEVLQALERRARTVRAKIAELDGALVAAERDARPGRAANEKVLLRDLRDARTHAETKLAEVVGSLESLRLELLRLHAGTGDTHGITRDLEAARAAGADVDRLIAAHSDARRAMEHDSSR